jgi:hypothetical protein
MKFYLYSTDHADPARAADATEWGLDPLEGEYDPEFEWNGRGADIPTLGGLVIQDYGVIEKDRKIRVAGRDLNGALRSALESKYLVANGEWHFTARRAANIAADVWKVRFRRVPRGFSAVLDGPTFAVGRMYQEPPDPGYERYRYELVLLVLEKIS